ncbi:MAG: hypothetical protein HYW24_01420 [Candidatus Aenigmarchaeota archaeon]|nr:hypothetical protein [Candidatus Aenigmarchaeota archaeon]
MVLAALIPLLFWTGVSTWGINKLLNKHYFETPLAKEVNAYFKKKGEEWPGIPEEIFTGTYTWVKKGFSELPYLPQTVREAYMRRMGIPYQPILPLQEFKGLVYREPKIEIPTKTEFKIHRNQLSFDDYLIEKGLRPEYGIRREPLIRYRPFIDMLYGVRT